MTSQQQILSFQPHERGIVATVLCRELDLETTGHLRHELETALAAAPTRSMVLDMSQVEFLPSVAMGMLVKLHKELTAAGRKLVLAGPTPFVLESLQVTALTRFLIIKTSVAEGIDLI